MPQFAVLCSRLLQLSCLKNVKANLQVLTTGPNHGGRMKWTAVLEDTYVSQQNNNYY